MSVNFPTPVRVVSGQLIVSSGVHSIVNIVNQSGEYTHVHENSLATIGHTDHEHHAGNKFIVAGWDMAVANTSGNEYCLLAFAPWSGAVSVNAVLDMDDVGSAFIWENPTVEASGTSVFARNANRQSTNSSYVAWYGGARVTSGTGIKLLNSRIGTAGVKSVGGTTETGGHSIIMKQSGLYAFVVWVDNNATGIAANIEYLEEM